MIGETLSIVGVGLIGGSLGAAVRRERLFRQVIGVGRNAESLKRAREMSIIDECSTDLAEAAARSDVLVFCTPVAGIVEQVIQAAGHCRAGTVISDAGSTKSVIVRELAGRLPAGVHFVGAHPVAGSEKGAEHANADLFRGRKTVVTPIESTDGTALDKIVDLWTAIGAEVQLLDPETHDEILGITSHLPHLVASALAGILPGSYRPLAASGFRDTTRIAAGDPYMWAGIFLQNRQALCEGMIRLTERMAELTEAVVNGDESKLVELLKEGKRVRDALGS